METIHYDIYLISFEVRTNFDFTIIFTNTILHKDFSCVVKYNYNNHFPFFDEDINFVKSIIQSCAKTNNMKITYNEFDALLVDFLFEFNDSKKIITKMFINNDDSLF